MIDTLSTDYGAVYHRHQHLTLVNLRGDTDVSERRLKMDFLTGMPYWGILALVLVNALIVWRMKIDIGKEG